jgi:hypothetical protein
MVHASQLLGTTRSDSKNDLQIKQGLAYGAHGLGTLPAQILC